MQAWRGGVASDSNTQIPFLSAASCLGARREHFRSLWSTSIGAKFVSSHQTDALSQPCIFFDCRSCGLSSLTSDHAFRGYTDNALVFVMVRSLQSFGVRVFVVIFFLVVLVILLVLLCFVILLSWLWFVTMLVPVAAAGGGILADILALTTWKEVKVETLSVCIRSPTACIAGISRSSVHTARLACRMPLHPWLG